jgi:methyl-accepting chemotaxis protein
MNFNKAILFHYDWKMKLYTYIQKPDHTLDPAKVEVDNRCDLGVWLHSEGTKYAGTLQYMDLVVEHAKFHKAAALIIRMVNAGQSVDRDTALGPWSEYTELSHRVVSLILDLKKVVSQGT